MIEIIILVVLCRNLATIIREKGHSPVGYVILLIFLWLGSEFMAGFLSGLFFHNMVIAYILALGGAALSAVLVFHIANNIEPTASSGMISLDKSKTYTPEYEPIIVYSKLTDLSEPLVELKRGDIFYIDNSTDWGEYYKAILPDRTHGYIKKNTKFIRK